MEGDGEGLVAIVQGLEHSGVTLTVCRPRQNADRSRHSGVGHRIQINAMNQRSDFPAVDQRINMMPAVAAAAPPTQSTWPALQRSSVETSTGPDFSRMTTASQICDGRYASSYKMAHCMVNPTSPPEMVTEFPPQRKEPCRNQGNFEIGGQGSTSWSGHGFGHNSGGHGAVPTRVSTSKVRHYGGTQTWADKGSSHRYSKSDHRETEAFAHSLRKYPSMAPFRTASTDFIEKLIRYTQAKNYQEMSRSTKSMRSLQHQKSSDTYETVRASKQQQTYTRRQDGNVTTSSHVQVGHRGRTKSFKLYSPMGDSRNFREKRHRQTTFSSSYDYLKAGNLPYGRSNRSDGSPSPTYSRSPERRRSPEESRSPDRSQSPDRPQSPERSRSPEGSRVIRADRSSRSDRPLRFERSVRDLSLTEMSRYIRSTIIQICNERPVVVQVCPKLKNRFNHHKLVCPNKNERSYDVMEFEEEEEEPEVEASGSVLSRFLQSFCGRPVYATEQAGCQCTRTDCYCSKATQCVNNPDVTTRTVACSCTTANTGCCRGMPCICAHKSQVQAYHKKRIDEEISEWLKDVPVTSIEDAESKKRRESIIKELRKTLKQLSDDENFEENAANEIQGFVNDFPVWNPGKDENDEKFFKNQLADKLTEKIIAIPRKPDRFRDIVKKWVANLNFEDDGEEIDMEAIIDNFVNRLKSLAADRPACDVKYTNLLRKEIIELLVELAFKIDGDMMMLKKMANNLATEIVSIPKNVNLSGETDLTSEFEDNIADWICEHGLCKELKINPKLIEGLAKKLNKIKSQGIYDDDVIEKMKEGVQQFVDDVGLAFETIDELIEELMDKLSVTIQIKEKERLDQVELIEEVSNWLRSLPGDDLHPRKLERITKDLVEMIQDSNEQENENLANDIVDYLVDTELSIDSADLGIYVEELMEKLNILPSNKFYKEQAKRRMLKDILNIIEGSPMPEDKKEEMKSKAKQIVELNLEQSSLNLIHAPDNVKDILLQDMDNAVSDISMPEKNRSQLKSLLGTSISRNFDKSFTRLSREQSDLKQTIAKDVKKAVKELPIEAGKKKELMQQVKGSLSKTMNKPLPSNIEDNINNGISDIVEKCPICEDRNILGRIKKVISEAASKYLTIYLPPCVCDIQNEIEEDVSTVIDRSSIDTGQKRELKESIQDILTDNEDRRLSDEVVRTIQDDISNVVSDLSIPRDEKDYLKKVVSETVSKSFNEAGKAFRYDLNKIRNKLLDDITNVIEKSPIQRDVKTHLKYKLNAVFAKNLDSSLSDEEKHMILDDVTNIFRDDMPEEQRINLKNKLAKKLETHQRKEETEGLIETINRLSIDPRVKEDMKKEIKTIFLETLYNPLSDDVQHKIEEDIFNAIDEMGIPEYDKNNLKSNISHTMAKAINKLISQDQEGPQIKSILEKVATNEINKSAISRNKKEILENRIKDVLTENLVRPVTDDVKETIKERLEHTVDDLISDKGKADAIKTRLLTVVDKDFTKSAQPRRRLKSDESLQDQKQTMDLKEIENIVLEMERIVDKTPIPREKKNELKKKLKNIATRNIEKPLDDVAERLKGDINVIFNQLNLPKDTKSKLKNALLTTVDEYMSYFQTAREDKDTESNEKSTYSKIGKGFKPLEEVDGNKIKDSILKGIEKIIDKSAVPEEKKAELKWKLKTLAAENLKKPFSQDVQDTIKTDMADIIDDLPISKSEKIKLESALTSIVDENVDDLRGEPRDQVSHLTGTADKPNLQTAREDKDTEYPAKKRRSNENTTYKKFGIGLRPIEKVDVSKVKDSILKGMEEIIDVSTVPEKKKVELKRKLKNVVAENLKQPFSKDVQEATKNGIEEILGDLPIPNSEKNKLKSELTSVVNKNVNNLRRKPRDQIDLSDESEDLTHDNILRETERTIENVIDKSAVPEGKKTELKRKLKTIAAENLKKPFSQDVQETVKTSIADIIDDLPIPMSEKIKLTGELTSIVDENLDNLRGEPRDRASRLRKSADKPLHNIIQDLDRAVEEASIPRGQKKELKKKLQNLATRDFKRIPLEDVAEALEDDLIEIIDELSLPKDKKNKLKRTVLTAVGEYMSNLQTVREDKDTEYSAKKRRSNEDTTYKKIGIGLKPIEEVEVNKVKDSILTGMEEIIDVSNVPEMKKVELKRKLKKVVVENLKKPFPESIQEATKNDIEEILGDLPIPNSEKNNLKSELTSMVNKNVNSLRRKPRDQTDLSEELEDLTHDNILREMERTIENVIDKSAVPERKKTELKRKLKRIAAENLKKPFSQDVQNTVKTSIVDIIDDLPIPMSEKIKLTSELTSIVDENVDNLRGEPRDRASRLRESADKPLHNIIQDLDRAVEEASIPRGQKKELKKKLQNLATRDFKRIPLEDVAEVLADDLIEIIDELSLPKDKKNKLKSTLLTAVGEYMSNFQTAREDKDTEYSAKIRRSNEDTTYKKMGIGLKPIEEVDVSKVKDSILKGIEKIIDVSTVPGTKKAELKRKLKNVVAENSKKPFSKDVHEAIKNGIEEILGDLPIPNSEKNKLKSELTSVVNKNVNNLRRKPRDQIDLSDELEDPRYYFTKKTHDNILRETERTIENVIDKSAVPEGKKTELKRKLKTIAAENMKKPFFQDVQDTVKPGIADIIDDLPIPMSEKIKLTGELTSIVDENLENLRREPRDRASRLRESADKPLHNIIQDIDRAVDEASMPRGQKKELKKKLQNLATRDFKRIPLEVVAEALEDDLIEIIDELSLPKDKKNKLKRTLLTAIGEYMSNLQTAREDKDTEYSAKKRRSNEDTTYKKNGIGLKPIEEVDVSKVKDSILKGMEEIIDVSNVPEKKKVELKRKLKNIVAENLRKPFSKDVQEATKNGIEEILGDLPIPNSEKNKLKSELTSVVNKNVNNLRRKPRDQIDLSDESENLTHDNILREMERTIEKVIDKSAVPEGKKTELKRKLKKIAAENLKKPFSQDVQNTLKTGIVDLIGDLPVPMSEKIKLKSELTSIVDENVDNLRGEPRDRVSRLKELADNPLHNIIQDIDRAVEEASLPRGLKKELKKKLQNLATRDFKRIPLEDVAEVLENDLIEIIDELNLTKDKKNKLKSTLLTAVGEYMRNLQTAREDKDTQFPDRKRKSNEDSVYNNIGIGWKPIEEVDVSEVKDSIFKGIEKIIDKSTVPEVKKVELKRKLQKVVAENLKKPFSVDDVRDRDRDLSDVRETTKNGMEQILGDLPISNYEVNKLKSELKSMVNENLDKLRCKPRHQIDHLKELEEDTQISILKGFQKVIDEAPIPKENIFELKKILKDIATKDVKKPLSDEVAETLKDDINVNIDGLNLPKYKKNNLKNALIAVVNENMSNYKNEKKLTKSSRNQHISPAKRRKISYPLPIIDESNLKESLKENIEKYVLQSNIPSSKKGRLNLDLRKMISNMLVEFDDVEDEYLKHIYEKYGIKTNYQNTLAAELDKLLEIALRGRDLEDARRKLIPKLMQELNLSEEVARALTDEMIEIAREMAQKQDVVDILESNTILQETKDKIKNCQEAFAKAINNAIDQSTISKPDKRSLKNKLLNKIQRTLDETPNKNNIGALKAEVLQECKKIVDASSIPAGKKKEIEMLLQKELAIAFGEEMIDNEESSDYGKSDDVSDAISLQESPTPEEYREKIIECIQTWMDNLPMDLDPKIVIAVAENLASDILDRQKYLQAHPEVISADNDEFDNLKYQVFRRMNNVVDPKNMPLVMERTGELYRMINGIEPPEGVPKLETSSKEQSSSQMRRRDQEPYRKKSTSATLSTRNIKYSLKELIATNMSVRKQWSKHIDNALSKLSLPKNETKDLKDNLAIYDETGQINVLSALNTTKKESNTTESSKSRKVVAPKSALKKNKGKSSENLSKIEKAVALNDTTKQKSPFSPNSNEPADVKEFTKKLKDAINTWLKKAKVDINQNEKNRILEELAIDIIQRQKYLQTFGVTPTQSDDLEYLKLQTHRRLNGLVPVEVLMQIIEKAKDLVPQINNVKVPQLVQVPQKSPSRQVPQKPPSREVPQKSSSTQVPQKSPSREVPQKSSSTQVPQKSPSREVPQKSPSPTQRKLGPADIRSKATNTAKVNRVSHTIDDDDGVEEESDTEFNPGQASTPSKSAAEQQEAADAEYLDKVTESVTNWLESMPIDLDPEVKPDIINGLTSDIVDRQKYLQVHAEKKFSDDEELENLRFQVFKRLEKVLEPDSSVTLSLQAKIEELYKMIAGEGRKKSLTAKQAQEFQNALNEEISAILNNYDICCDKRNLLPKLANELTKLRNSGADQDEVVENLIVTVQPLTYLSDEDAEDLAYKLLYRTKKLIGSIRGDAPLKKKDFKEAMMKDTGDVFESCPMSQPKRRLIESQLTEGNAKDLGSPFDESNSTTNETGPESKKVSYGMSFNGLSNFIDTWLSSIYSEDDDTKDEDEILIEKREKMYCLVHKIGEMNVDPEIFNDDFLYEAVLREELQHVLDDIKIDEEEFQALKEDLVEKVLEAHRRAHDEIAGQNYKKNLRDTLSELLPDQRNFSREDQATIETLKDKLADAYIDLHYSGNNENQRDQLKRKITNEINTFCKDYLNRNPCSPLNSKALNDELYTALNEVPLPPGDSVRYEVEQARIREEINDWVKELPLQPQSPTQLLARNKLIYVLSKKLFDSEVEEQEEDEDNELKRKQIVKFLNKLPLESEEEYDAFADTLINKLKASEGSRKYNATSNVTIDAFGNVSAASNASSVNPSGYKLLFGKSTPCAPRKVCARHLPRQSLSIPPCTLSPEDRAHLQQIRRRTCMSPSCVTSLIKKHKCHTGAEPPPVDAGSQTALRPFDIEDPQQNRVCPFAYEKMHRPSPKVSANLPYQQYAQENTESVEMEKPQSSPICPAAFEHASRICPGGPSRSPQPGQQMRRHTISSSNVYDGNEEVQPQYAQENTESVEMEKPQSSPICPAAFEKASRICPGGPSRSPHPGQQMRRHTISSSNIYDGKEEVQPQIHIKQHYWNPSDKTSVDNSEQQQSGRSGRRVSESLPCRQPGPPPCHTPRLAPCSPPRLAPCRPTPSYSPRPASCRTPPCQSPRPTFCRTLPGQSPRPASCRSPGPCNRNPTCFSQPGQTYHRPNSAKLRQQSSPQSKSPRHNSSEHYSNYDPQSPFQKSSQTDIPSSRSPCSPSPCMSSFGQCTPPGSSGFPKRSNEFRMPKADGLQDQVPSNSSRPSQKERVIELGSLDDVSARPKKRTSDQTDWPKFQEEDHFWTPSLRRAVLDQGIDESVVLESERQEERVTCRCKERLFPKSGRPHAGNCPSQPFSQGNEDGQNLRRCSKCCGMHCPYPSFLYFRQ